MSEAQLQSSIIELARWLGWRVAHFRTVAVKRGDRVRYETPVQADGKGFPDLVLAHPKRGVIFAELKSETGRLEPEQDVWIAVLQDAGAHVAVWKPRDYLSGAVEATLRAALGRR